MEFLNKAKGIITPNKKVYYPSDNRSGGIADSNLMYNIPKSYSGGGSSGGGGAEPLIVNIIDGGELSGDALDRTWQEIHDAFPNVILRDMPSDTVGECESLYSVIKVNKINGPAKTTYSVEIMKPSTSLFSIYSTKDPNGYPKIDGGGIN